MHELEALRALTRASYRITKSYFTREELGTMEWRRVSLSSVLSRNFFFDLKLAFSSYYTRCMSGRRLRLGKIVGKAQKQERKRKTSLRIEEEITKQESAMSDAILEELKSLRSDLTQQMQKISDELATFQGTTDTRLAKIESVISKIDEIDNLKPKVEKLEEKVADMKQSVNITLNETNSFQKTVNSLVKEL